MDSRPVSIFAAAALFLALIGTVAASAAQKVNKVKVTKVRSGKAVFDYSGLEGKGPDKWGNISPDFAFCKKGQHQSPINLVINNASANAKVPTVELYESVVEYAPSGLNYVLNCNGAAGGRYCSTIRYSDGVYHMLQAHFHSPSEHHINGKAFPLEIHLVHQREDKKGLLVLGILFDLGEYNPDVQKLIDGADQQNKQVVDFNRIVGSDTGLCTYEGSLTTPPCTEGVHWLLSNSHPTVSLLQVGKYREQVGEKTNNRPVQIPVADPEARCYLNPNVQNKVAPSDNTPIEPQKPSTDGTVAAAGANKTTENPCFPADARVELEGGRTIPIAQVQIGDKISVGSGKYSEVYAFSHRDFHAVTEHVQLSFWATSDTLTLTPGHYLEVNGVLIPAGATKVGDTVIGSDGNKRTVRRVATSIDKTGLFNPHTLDGSIAVNGVVCSTYTTSVKRSTGQALLAPIRSLFRAGHLTYQFLTSVSE